MTCHSRIPNFFRKQFNSLESKLSAKKQLNSSKDFQTSNAIDATSETPPTGILMTPHLKLQDQMQAKQINFRRVFTLDLLIPIVKRYPCGIKLN